MKQLCFLVPLFSIPLVNGMVNQHVELEQSVEEPNVAVAEMHSLDIPQVELDVHEAKRPLLSRRAKAIIAFAFLALLLALTFYSVYKIKHKERLERLERERLVAEWEQKLVKFREFVKEEEKQLTKAQKKTLQNMKEQVKEFIEKGYNPVFFEQELKNNLMQFLADGLGGPIWNFNFKKLFERSFFDSFFDVENYYFVCLMLMPWCYLVIGYLRSCFGALSSGYRNALRQNPLVVVMLAFEKLVGGGLYVMKPKHEGCSSHFS